MSDRRCARPLRWYPPEWRTRYGDEMVALLEDSYGSADDVPIGHRLGLARAGLSERARAAGLTGSSRGPAARLRAGSVLVLSGWALFLVAMAVFGKVTDNWYNDSPVAGRWVASSGYNTVTVVGAIGCLVVFAAALLVLPAFIRLVRAGGWRDVRGAVQRALGAGVVAAGLLVAAVSWAHHLSTHDRNGGKPVYGAFFLLVSAATILAIVLATAAAAAVARRVELSHRTLRVLAGTALGLAVLMVLGTAGFVAWWASESTHAPGVLLNGLGNGVPYSSATVPPTLLGAGLAMADGLALAAWGAVRIAGPLRQRSWPV